MFIQYEFLLRKWGVKDRVMADITFYNTTLMLSFAAQ